MKVRIGDPVPRKEDLRLLTGRGRYADDIRPDRLAYAAFVRSPHAHAEIVSIDADQARAAPGVLAVLTGRDSAEDGLRPIPHMTGTGGGVDIALVDRPGFRRFVTEHRVLPQDRVRFPGEPAVLVVAETVEQAKDAAEQVRIEWRPLPAAPHVRAATAPGAEPLWPEAGSNLCVDSEVGDATATEAAFARAARTVRLETWVQRVTGAHLEPRTSIAWFDPATERYTLHAAGGTGVVWMKQELATVLGVAPDRIRVMTADVGGNFGTRNAFYPEFALIAWAARRIARPVKYRAERQESMLSDYQARDLWVEAELALDAEGTFLALRSRNVSNVGSHTASFTALVKGVELMTGVYRIESASVNGQAVVTNTPSTVPYRSAGRPEAMFVLERLIDLVALEHGLDRVELRRRNLIPPEALPFRTPLGITYDGGDYPAVMDWALELGDWAGFPARRAEARRRGRLRGIGVANYIEVTSGIPRERAELRVRPEGMIEVVIGTLATGQGHETAFSQLVADWLGVPFEQIRIIEGDSDVVAAGGGSHSGRSMRFASIVLRQASLELVARATERAARALEVGEADLRYAEGRFTIDGTDRRIGLFELATIAGQNGSPEGPLEAVSDQVIRTGGFPFGCHVCEVEVDPETGAVEVASYAAVDDVGRAINPLILHGQTHGGIAQGLGQALIEACVYDAQWGQLLSGSFLDYAMPRADDFPMFRTALSEIPSPSHPLGIRPGGEGGSTPALAVAINAIVDALAELGVRHIEMPATPERIWRAIRNAAARAV